MTQQNKTMAEKNIECIAHRQEILALPLVRLSVIEPDLWAMLQAMLERWPCPGKSLKDNIDNVSEAMLRENGLSRQLIYDCVEDFFAHLHEGVGERVIETITIVGGQGKDGTPENITLEINCGEVVCLVGPTGSGKSQLLCDLECLAQEDTPSRRKVLLDGQEPDDETRFSIEYKLIAQLSQNMNFVMDIPAGEFIAMHARSRLKPEPDALAEEVLAQANSLAGEKFFPQTPLTGLSGGQSRALMIADTAMVSDSPVVLIDEIENAGVDRRKALELLLSRNKIIFLATHDPVLALLADRRINIRDGAVRSITATSEEEKNILQVLLKNDQKLSKIRANLRGGLPLV